MAKRKLGVSIIILCIAAVTLISGTYAWFLVGGFAELFDIGFDVIEAKGGVLLRGDKLTYGGGKNDNEGWGNSLEREDFTEFSFIVNGGKYKPISSADGKNFIAVTMEDDKFICEGEAITKRSGGITAEDICYNEFTFFIKSTAAEIVPDDEGKGGAYIKIKLTGETFDSEGKPVLKDENDKYGAGIAARVAIQLGNETPKIYSIDGQNYNAVTSVFENRSITDTSAVLHETKYIIDSADTGNVPAAGLTPVTSPRLMEAETDNEIKISLGNIPGFDDPGTDNVQGSGKRITISIWLEGNDPECISFGEGAVAGKSLMSHISFGVDE